MMLVGLSIKDIDLFTNPHMEGRFLYLLPQVAAKIAALQLIRQPFITIVTQKENTCV